MSSVTSDFIEFCRRCGLTPPDRVTADGNIHRFRSGPERTANGFYRLVVLPAHKGGDIGFGTVGCWKRGVSEKWCSREARLVTTQDRTRLEQIREKQRADETAAARASARKATGIWAGAAKAPADHPYLVAKKINPHGLRLHKGMLVAPVRRSGEITSLQFIGPDGDKRFLKGGQVDGGYASISGGSKDRSKIVIAEGYATAASLHEATGFPAIAAFNAGNIMAVAKEIRAKYPEAEIIIGADNDRFTVIRGEPVNVGIVKAKAVVDAIGGRASWPVFADDDGQPTDWNDHASRYGLERTRNAFLGLEPDPVWGEAPEQEFDAGREFGSAHDRESSASHLAEATGVVPGGRQADDWKARLIPGKEVAEGHPFPFDGKSKTNAYLFLKHHPRFVDVLAYNEFTDAVMLLREPPWGEARFLPRRIRDDDFFMLCRPPRILRDLRLQGDGRRRGHPRGQGVPGQPAHASTCPGWSWDRKPQATGHLADLLPGGRRAARRTTWRRSARSGWSGPSAASSSRGASSTACSSSKARRGWASRWPCGRSLDLQRARISSSTAVGDIRSKDTLMTMQGKLIVEIAELASLPQDRERGDQGVHHPPGGRVSPALRPHGFAAAPVLRAGRLDQRDRRGLPDRRHRQPPLLAGAVPGHRRPCHRA